MDEATPISPWRFYKVGLIVTGKGESNFLPALFRALTESGTCTFQFVRKISQRSPMTSEKKTLRMVGTGKQIPTKDEQEIGIPAREWLLEGNTRLLLLVDDLEHDRRDAKGAIFDRYRKALDTMLRSEEQQARASVHFLVNMLEAYYFADAAAVNAVLGTSLSDATGDVEEIRHPKNDLKTLYAGFDEIEHGKAIVRGLKVEHVLDNLATCASLRVIFGWCAQSMGMELGPRFRLDSGAHDVITGRQLGGIRRAASSSS
jgi:Domain of unknown function (DUF4276)